MRKPRAVGIGQWVTVTLQLPENKVMNIMKTNAECYHTRLCEVKSFAKVYLHVFTDRVIVNIMVKEVDWEKKVIRTWTTYCVTPNP